MPIWLILLLGFVVGLVVLALAAWPLVSRVGPLQRAMAGLQRRAAEAEALQAKVEELQSRIPPKVQP